MIDEFFFTYQPENPQPRSYMVWRCGGRKSELKKIKTAIATKKEAVLFFLNERDIYTIYEAAKNGIRRRVHGFVAAARPEPRQ